MLLTDGELCELHTMAAIDLYAGLATRSLVVQTIGAEISEPGSTV